MIKDKRTLWIFFGIATIFLRMVLVNYPALIEQWYSRGFFQVLRFLFDWTIGCLPFPVLYILILTVPAWLIWKLTLILKSTMGWKDHLIQIIFSLTSLTAAVVALFLWSWGFNYLRIPIEEQIGIKPSPLSTLELREELDVYTDKIIEARRKIASADDRALTAPFLPKELDLLVSPLVVDLMLEFDYPAAGSLPVRTLLQGSLLRIGTAGFYLPFTGECNIDKGLHPLQKPYVMAHEMAHGLGIGDEGSCNFIALLSCATSKNAFVRYSGYLSFWRTLAINYKRHKPEEYRNLRTALPAGIIADLDAINENSRNYPDLFPVLRDQTYDAFLKTQGISEGMQNYNRVIVLARAYRLNSKGI